jgi:hypothetical protein
MRVTARMSARPRAINPVASAPRWLAAPASVVVLAACRAVPARDALEPGATVGSKPEALSPGLSEDAGVVKLGRGRGNSDDDDDDIDDAAADGVGDAVAETATDAVACGSVDRFGAVAVAVRETAVTVVRVSGMATWAWNSR